MDKTCEQIALSARLTPELDSLLMGGVFETVFTTFFDPDTAERRT